MCGVRGGDGYGDDYSDGPLLYSGHSFFGSFAAATTAAHQFDKMPACCYISGYSRFCAVKMVQHLKLLLHEMKIFRIYGFDEQMTLPRTLEILTGLTVHDACQLNLITTAQGVTVVSFVRY